MAESPRIDLDDARSRLESERDRLRGLVENLRAGFEESRTDSVTELAAYDQHQADAGTETFEREKDQAILEQLVAQLEEVEAALDRVENGSYGIDEETGEPIDPERLAAVPTARTNVRR